MSRVRIIIDGIEHTVDKKIFKCMMNASYTQADQWAYNASRMGDEALKNQWAEVSSRSEDLDSYI